MMLICTAAGMAGDVNLFFNDAEEGVSTAEIEVSTGSQHPCTSNHCQVRGL